MTTIRIWIFEGVNGDWVEADQNYYLQAPGMKEPAVPESPATGTPRRLCARSLPVSPKATRKGSRPAMSRVATG